MLSNRYRVAFVLLLALAMTALSLTVTVAPARADHFLQSWHYSDPVTTDPNTQTSSPAVLDDQAGNFYVSYNYLNTVAGTWNVYISKYQDSQIGGDTPRLFEAQVNTVANVGAGTLGTAMTLDPSGNLYVAWVRQVPGLGQEVYVSKSATGGATWVGEVRGNAAGAAGNDYWPKIASTPSGTIYLGWLQYWNSQSVSVSRSTDGGVTFDSWTNVSVSTSTFTPTRFDLTTDSHGRLFLVVEGYITATGHNVIEVMYSDDGVTWSAPVTLSATSVSNYGPTAKADGQGGVYVAWLSALPLGFRLEVTSTHDGGATWSPAFPVTQGLFSPVYIPTIAVEHDTVMVAYGAYSSGYGIGYVVSPDRGANWYPEQLYTPTGVSPGYTLVNADANGTFYAAYESSGSMVRISAWHSPPSAPTGTAAVGGTGSLTVSWAANPEPDVVAYQVYRSVDGISYQFVGSVPATQTSFTDAGLANGTYFYRLVAVDNQGIKSHDSASFSGTVGPTTAELIANLQSQITALQNQLAQVNASSSAAIAAARAQIASLQAQLAALQSSQAAANAATAAQIAQLQANITALQNKLNDIQASQATQTMSYANLAFEVIVVVLLVVLLIVQMRKPKTPRMMMAQPGQASSSPPQPGAKAPEDEL